MFWPFFRHMLAHQSQQPFNLASSGAKVIGQAPSKPPVRWNSWDPWLSLKIGWKMDERWMKKNVMYAIVRPIHHPWRPVRNSKFESSYVIMFLFHLAIFWETLLLCGFALLVGHDATTHEVTLQGPPVIVDHLKVEIIALLHEFSRIPMRKRQVIPTWPRGFSKKHDETWPMTDPWCYIWWHGSHQYTPVILAYIPDMDPMGDETMLSFWT